jgi:hypothetical protein
MSLAGGAGIGGGSFRRSRQAGVSGLADLNRPVVDELGGDQAGPGGDQDRCRGSARSDRAAGGSGGSNQQSAGSAHGALSQGDGAEDEGGDGAEARTEPFRAPATQPQRVVARVQEDRIGPLEPSIGDPIDLAGPATERCYHRPSLRQFFRRTLRRAPWGLFFGLIHHYST